MIRFAAVWWRALHSEFEADKGVVMEATKPYGGVHEYASEELRAYKGTVTVTEAVSLRGRLREPD